MDIGELHRIVPYPIPDNVIVPSITPIPKESSPPNFVPSPPSSPPPTTAPHTPSPIRSPPPPPPNYPPPATPPRPPSPTSIVLSQQKRQGVRNTPEFQFFEKCFFTKVKMISTRNLVANGLTPCYPKPPVNHIVWRLKDRIPLYISVIRRETKNIQLVPLLPIDTNQDFYTIVFMDPEELAEETAFYQNIKEDGTPELVLHCRQCSSVIYDKSLNVCW